MGLMILPVIASLSEDAITPCREPARGRLRARRDTRQTARCSGWWCRRRLGHHRRGDPRRLARHRRDDDRGHRRRPAAAPHGRPARAGRDDDRLHRAGEPRRHARRARSNTGPSSRSASAVPHDAVRSTLSRTGCERSCGRCDVMAARPRPKPASSRLQPGAPPRLARRRARSCHGILAHRLPLAVLVCSSGASGRRRPRLTWQLPHELPVTKGAESAGILPAFVGSAALMRSRR
jgi:hypothetical protein